MVIFESTYAPFTTKNVCMKIIKKESKIDSIVFYMVIVLRELILEINQKI